MIKLSKQKIAELSISFVIAEVVVHTGFINSVIAFMIAGVVPGTNFSISPLYMMALYGLVGSVLIIRILFASSPTRAFQSLYRSYLHSA